MAAAPEPFRLLYVCQGNIARSPLAAAYTRAYVEKHEKAADWLVDSAGTHAHPSEPPRPEVLRVAEGLGVDLDGYNARLLEPDRLFEYDLILSMSFDQAAHIWSVAPGAWDRSFTVKEFIHWVKQAPPKPALIFPHRIARMRDRVDQAHTVRKRARAEFGFWGGLRPQDQNVVEPEGRSDAAWRAFGQTIRALATDVVHLLGGP